MAGEQERVLQHFCTLITGELGLQEVEEGKWETGNPLSGSDGLPSLDWGDLNNPLGRRQEEGASPPASESDLLLLSSEQLLDLEPCMEAAGLAGGWARGIKKDVFI